MRIRPMVMAISRLAATAAGIYLLSGAGLSDTSRAQDYAASVTTTPIQHLVVIFQENVSFDHYFGTYPDALNPPSEQFFHASDDTPSVNGLGRLVEGAPDGVLLTDNPNRNNPGNASNAINPFRLSPSQAATCDQDHNYGHEQQAFDQGLMDLFPATVGVGSCKQPYDWDKSQGLVMGYFDGNTVTALWNYAQNYAMSDNSFGTTFGPSTPGLLNLIAGNTYPATPSASNAKVVPNNTGPGTLVGDLDPTGDVCSTGTTVQLGGKNMHDFFDALAVRNMPAVSFLKAIAAEDGHAGYSDPLLEQKFLVRTVNAIMRSPFWNNTAIVILYDDSDGWYDHQMSPIVNSSAAKSSSPANSDELNGDGICGHGTPAADASGTPIQGRCAYGPRQPLLVISPFAKRNYVDHTLTDQTSVLRFIEDNWQTGRIGGSSFDELAGSLLNMFNFGGDRGPADGHAGVRLFLDETTGQAR